MADIFSFDKRPAPPLIEVWQKYCADRGLTDKMITPMKGALLTLEQASKHVGLGVYGPKSIGGMGAFVFPISAVHSIYQARIMFNPNWGPPETPPVGPQIDYDKLRRGMKYIQAKGSPGSVYIPPHLTDWWDVEARYDLLIVEGALNAVRLAAEGYHAIAITGVDSIRIAGKNTPVIPELLKIVESRQVQRVTVLFDSDVNDLDKKRNLAAARFRLLLELQKIRVDRAETIYECSPPPRPDGSKNGPDDYLNTYGINVFNKLLNERSERFSDHPYIQLELRCCERFIFEEISGTYWDNELRKLLQKDHTNTIMLDMGGIVEDIHATKINKTSFDVKKFHISPHKRTARGLVYNPATDEPYFTDSEGVPRINKFHPDDVPKAIKGDVSIALEVLNSLCRNTPEAIDKVLTIAARHAQYPDRTPKYGLLFTGEQRAGKTLMAKLIGRALSKRFSCDKIDLRSGFNDLWRGFACREWAEFDPNMDEEWLKDLITSDAYLVNAKYGAQYTDRNLTLNVFTCNGLQSKVQEGDKRFLVCGYARNDNQRLGLEFERWINEGPGISAFRYHLLNEIDVAGYDTLDLYTHLKDEVIDASKSYKATVRDEVLSELDLIEGLECVPNFLLDHLLERHRMTVTTFNKANAQYFVQPNKEIVSIKGTLTRFRAFKNIEFWRKDEGTNKYVEQYEIAVKYLDSKMKRSKF
jgi:hypothetical protein